MGTACMVGKQRRSDRQALSRTGSFWNPTRPFRPVGGCAFRPTIYMSNAAQLRSAAPVRFSRSREREAAQPAGGLWLHILGDDGGSISEHVCERFFGRHARRRCDRGLLKRAPIGPACAATPQASHKAQTRSCCSVRLGSGRGRGSRRSQGPFGRPLVFSGLPQRSIAGNAPRRPIPSCRPWPESAVAAGYWSHLVRGRSGAGILARQGPYSDRRPEACRFRICDFLWRQRGARAGASNSLKIWSRANAMCSSGAGGRLRIDQQQDPAVLFRCFT